MEWPRCAPRTPAHSFYASVKWPAARAALARRRPPSSPRLAARALPPLPPVSLASSSQAGAPWRCARAKPTATLTTPSSTAAASSEWWRTSRVRPGAVSGQRRPNERAERLLRPQLGSILPPKVALLRRRQRGRRSGFWESSVCRRRAHWDRWPGAPGTLSPQICAHSFLELASDTFHLISPWFESSPSPPRSTSF